MTQAEKIELQRQILLLFQPLFKRHAVEVHFADSITPQDHEIAFIRAAGGHLRSLIDLAEGLTDHF
jgi:hypothetical protein